MKPQWWVKMKDLAEPAIKAVKDGEIKIRPETAERSYFRWLEDINDWCISRQLWWGHRCPVYFAKVEGENSDINDEKLWFSGRTREEAEAKAKKALPGKTFTPSVPFKSASLATLRSDRMSPMFTSSGTSTMKLVSPPVSATRLCEPGRLSRSAPVLPQGLPDSVKSPAAP